MEQAIGALYTMPSSQDDILRRCAEGTAFEDIIELCIVIFDVSQGILPDTETLRGTNIFSMNSEHAIDDTILKCFELRKAMQAVTLPVKRIERPVLKSIMYALTIGEIMDSVLSWQFRATDVRPDITNLLCDEITGSDEYSLRREHIFSKIGYNKDAGPGTSRLRYGQCSRNCISCPIASPLAIRDEDLHTAELYRCPMHASRLATLYDPMISVVAASATVAVSVFHASTMSQESYVKLLRDEVYFNMRLDTMRSMLDQMEPIQEDRTSILGLNAGVTMGWEHIMEDGPTAPWRGITKYL